MKRTMNILTGTLLVLGASPAFAQDPNLIDTQRDDGTWAVRSTLERSRDEVTDTAVYWGSAWAVIGLAEIKPGAAQTTRLDSYDADGELVCQTYQLGISRGVAVTGQAPPVDDVPAWPQRQRSEPLWRFPVAVSAGAAHVYTECARIFNPIHTDRAVALAAGLPDIILHGTATLALAVTTLVDHFLESQPQRVRRLGGRFSAMVLMPSTITVQIFDRTEDTLFFEVLTEDGQTAFSHGFLCFEQQGNGG